MDTSYLSMKQLFDKHFLDELDKRGRALILSRGSKIYVPELVKGLNVRHRVPKLSKYYRQGLVLILMMEWFD